jgi:transposase
MGRASIPPEKLLRALLLQCLCSVRSERLLMEHLDYNLVVPWFVGLNSDEPVWHPTYFFQERRPLAAGDVAQAFFAEVGNVARKHGLLSDEDFTADGTLIEAWGREKSFKPKSETAAAAAPPGASSWGDAGNPSLDFRGESRCNDTHESATHAETRLCKKAGRQEAKLAFLSRL